MNWTDYGAIGISAAALVVSGVSIFVSWLSFRISKKQDEQRKPSIVPSWVDGFVSSNANDEMATYAFNLSISNRSSEDNSIAKIDLRITYNIGNLHDVSIIVSALSEGAVKERMPAESLLFLPVKIAGHQTIAGWCLFELSLEVLRGRAIETTEVVVTDTYGNQSAIEPVVLREIGDEPTKS